MTTKVIFRKWRKGEIIALFPYLPWSRTGDAVTSYMHDHAPYSFGFAEKTADGKYGIVGGLLYHGKPDQSFAVILEPFHGWSIHT